MTDHVSTAKKSDAPTGKHKADNKKIAKLENVLRAANKKVAHSFVSRRTQYVHDRTVEIVPLRLSNCLE